MPGTGNGDDDGGIQKNVAVGALSAMVVLIDGVSFTVPTAAPIYPLILEWAASATPSS